MIQTSYKKEDNIPAITTVVRMKIGSIFVAFNFMTTTTRNFMFVK
jgi:hypothetical protein